MCPTSDQVRVSPWFFSTQTVIPDNEDDDNKADTLIQMLPEQARRESKEDQIPFRTPDESQIEELSDLDLQLAHALGLVTTNAVQVRFNTPVINRENVSYTGLLGNTVEEEEHSKTLSKSSSNSHMTKSVRSTAANTRTSSRNNSTAVSTRTNSLTNMPSRKNSASGSVTNGAVVSTKPLEEPRACTPIGSVNSAI
mmetsp:Transcript_30587/g.59672  ORF Transcript_30587/g.59672 Transcript_30587/m.59672 type:complete len:196 (-) Transcript_30587:249-836(-)